MKNNLSTIANEVTIKDVIPGAKFIIEIEGNIIFETKIVGSYNFIQKRLETKILGKTEVSFISGDFVVLENDFAIWEGRLNWFYSFENGNITFSPSDKERESIEQLLREYYFVKLDDFLETHLSAIEFMKQSVEDVQSNKTHIRLINDREEVGNKTYHAEGMFDKNEVVDMFSEQIIDSSTLDTFEIERVEKHYVHLNEKYTTKNVYFLKNSDKVAIDSPIFAPSDVYFIDLKEFKKQVI